MFRRNHTTKRTRLLLALTLLVSCLSFATVSNAAGLLGAPPAYCSLSHFGDQDFGAFPVYSVRDFGAVGDGITNDTAAIQKAFDDTPSYAVLEFPHGIYLHDKSLILATEGVVLMGRGGILKGMNPLDQTIEITGDSAAVINMTIQGVGHTRSAKSISTKIWVRGQWNQILGNSITGGASVGIMGYGARDFRIEGNHVTKTLADGIHITNGSRRGVVGANTVASTGDDGIAVVSYQTQDFISGDVIIRDNRVSDIVHGRGITVVGGESVLIENNHVSDITSAAGILIAQERAYNTYGVKNIIVQHNQVENIQIPRKDRYTHHGAIDVNSSGEKQVSTIFIKDNMVDNTRFAAIRVLGDICNVDITGNTMSKIQDENPIFVFRAACAPQKIGCSKNTLDGNDFMAKAKFCSEEVQLGLSFETSFQSADIFGWLECDVP